MLTYMAALGMMGFCGAYFGLSVGTMTSDQNVAILIGNLFVTLFNFGAGCFANTGSDANPVIKFLSWISPMHYGVEVVFKQVTKGRPGADQLYTGFGYEDSIGVCFGYLIFFTLLMVALGWLNIWY